MRAVKLTFVVAAMLALVRYIPVYYRTSEFNQYVKVETRHARAKGQQLKNVLLSKAGQYRIPIREENIQISTRDSVFRVAVDYRVPVNLFVFQHELAFHTVASRPIFGE